MLNLFHPSDSRDIQRMIRMPPRKVQIKSTHLVIRHARIHPETHLEISTICATPSRLSVPPKYKCIETICALIHSVYSEHQFKTNTTINTNIKIENQIFSLRGDTFSIFNLCFVYSRTLRTCTDRVARRRRRDVARPTTNSRLFKIQNIL